MLNINIEINNESIMSGHAKTSYVMWVLYMVLTDSTTSGLESHNLKLKEISGVLYLYSLLSIFSADYLDLHRE